MPAGREYEIKAVFRPDRRPELEVHPLLAALRQARPVQMLSTYFDTDDLALWRAGFSLRLRKTHEGVVQTLKQNGVSTIDRGEWEWRRATDNLDFDVLHETPVRRCLERLKGRLAPRFVVDVARTRFDLRHADTLVEGAIDEGTIQARGRRLPVCEIEFELKRGAPGDVVALARRLIGDLPLTPAVATKSERGFGLLHERDAHPIKGLDVELPAGASIAQACATLVAGCAGTTVRNAALIDTVDKVEAVHQTRVAIRRLRAALLLFKPRLNPARVAHLETELKWIAGLLGAARDCDVHQDLVFDPAARRRDAPFGSDRLAVVMHGVRTAAHETVTEALGSPRWRLLLLDLLTAPLLDHAADVDTPFAPFVVKRLKTRRKRLLAMTDRVTDLSPDDRHTVRKKAKALRYALSFFGEGLPGARRGRYGRTIKALAVLQETLGDLHDHDALRALLCGHAADPAAAIHKQDEGGRIASVFAAGALAARPIAHRALLKRAERAFRRVRRSMPF